MAEPLLRLDKVTLEAPDGRRVFEDLDWTLEQGARFRIRGGLGNGATAFLRLCAGLAKPFSGQVLLEGRPLDADALDHPYPARGDLGFVPTDGGLAVNLTLLQNVSLPLRFARRVEGAEADAQALRWLERVGLRALAAQRPRNPPDRVCWLASLARAAAKGSRLWLVDRPAGGLDRASVGAARSLLEEAAADPGTTLLLVGGDWMNGLGEELRIEEGRIVSGSGA